MDPAEADHLRQAVGNQGNLLGHHDSVLQDLSAEVRGLTQAMAALQTSPRSVSSSPMPSALHATPRPSNIKAPHPERYDGDLGKCGGFILQCSLVFELQAEAFTTDRSKVAFVISCLKGRALEWAKPLWEEQGRHANSYAAFTREMSRVFDHPVRGKEAARRLLHLRQGARSVAEYAVEFRTLAGECAWEAEPLTELFQNGLSEVLKDELASRDEPGGMEELIALAIKIDNRLRERRRERRAQSPRVTDLTAMTMPRPSLETSAMAEPMEVGARVPGRVKCSPEERLRRRLTKSCYYCGKQGHQSSACPNRPQGNETAH